MVSSEQENAHWSRSDRQVWTIALFTGTMLTFAARNSMPLSAVEISHEFNWDKTETGLILSCFYWGYASTQILSGWLSDRFGGDRVVTTAALGWGFITFLTPYFINAFEVKSDQLNFMVFVRVLFAATQAFHYPALASLLSKKVTENSGRSKVYATVMAGTSAGNVLSGSLGSFLLARYGWHSVFYTFGALSVMWALAMKFFLMEDTSDNIKLNGQVAKLASQKPVPKAAIKDVPWKRLISHPAFWALILGRFCLNYSFHLLFSWLPTYFTEKFPGENGYIFNVVPWLLCVPSGIIAGFIADKIISSGYSVTVARKCMHTIECSGVIVCLLAISQVDHFSTAVLFATAALVFQTFGLAGVFANPQDIAPDYAGAVFGVMNTAGAIPGFIGVYVAGHLLEYLHSWPAVFCSTACVSFLGWMIFFIFGTGSKII